jgi:hypothetical protein
MTSRNTQASSYFLTLVVAGLFGWGTGCSWIEHRFAVEKKCVCEFRVYSWDGQLLPFRVSSVTLAEGSVNGDRWQRHVEIQGSRTWFPAGTVGVQIRVQMSDGAGRTLDRQVPIGSCDQRTSFLYGSEDKAQHDAAFEISGRLTGCKLNADWWVRALDMYGEMTARQHPSAGMPKARDGFLDFATGVFSIPAGSPGPQIVVVGMEKDPLIGVVAGTVERRRGDLGTIDISSFCMGPTP